jgi:hypothetical protein
MNQLSPKVFKDTRKYDTWAVRARAGDQKRKWVNLLTEQLDKHTTYGKLSESLLLRIVSKLTAKPNKCWFIKNDKLKVSYTNGQRGMVSVKLLLYEALNGPLGPESRRYSTTGKSVSHRTRQRSDAVPPKGCRCVNPHHMDYI